ncbi:RES family NAD+ phosphorylase [Roseovarius atlanticus]|uniref:RES family NAD+ phosphorylase n=1 Tax=Roseovarius atlanticus TaxID=1641875 RepID=UPI0021BDEFFF|nr:RES family NAD+ phosphorylase [Roseovarius atlanticus]
MVAEISDVPVSHVQWKPGVRIIRSVFPPIDLFEDIAEPEDWPLLISAEQKTNPRLMESIGNIDLVPVNRRVGGQGASFLMAPFTHASEDRPSRFSHGRLGILYVASDFETAVHETSHHHARFMAATDEAPGWVSQFRELQIDVDARLHDIRNDVLDIGRLLDPDDYSQAQLFGADLRADGSDGIVYPSVRGTGDCVGLFYPDTAGNPVQGNHLDYHWDGKRVDLIRNATTGDVFRVVY